MKLLLVLSERSRFDRENKGLLVGSAADFVYETLARIGFSSTAVRVCLLNHPGFAADINWADYIVLCGETAANQFHRTTLNRARGYVVHVMGKPCVSTFAPQDCVDFKNYEGKYKERPATGYDKDDAETRWPNRGFWFEKDLWKLLSGYWQHVMVGEPAVVRCNGSEIIEVMREWTGETVFFDIETDPRGGSLSCFSVCVESSWAKNVVFSWLAYDCMGQGDPKGPEVLAALALCMKRNRFVIHNCGFDLNFLALNYRIPYGDLIFDTMVATHRLFREADKSLAHCISLYVNRRYHKDEALFVAHNRAQEEKLLNYNASDVLTLRAIYRAMHQFWIPSIPGAKASIEDAMSMLPIYLTMGFTGLPISELERISSNKVLEGQVDLLLRAIRVLIGNHEFNPGSPQQLGKYLYKDWQYTPPHYTKTGAPSTDEEAIQKLALKHPMNLALRCVLKYRSLKKKLSMQESFKTYTNYGQQR